MKKIRNILTLALSGLFLAGFLLAAILTPDRTDSLSERRKLAQRPALRASAVADGTYMTAFEKYTLDQFPLRDSFRALKAFFSGDILRQLDNNGVYAAGGHLAKLDYPVNTDLTFAEYIDIFDTLSLDMYYRTDTHWRQETLGETAAAIAAAMGASLPAEYETVDVSSAFRGVYAGQYALPVEPDALRYLTNGTIAALRVYDYETGAEIPVYDLTLAAGRDGYEMFLGGTKALLTIENPNAETDRELVIFRDSFGSSIAPLLAQGYAKVTVVDIRYMAPALAGRFVDLSQADDVLFLYSTGVLNHSETIQ